MRWLHRAMAISRALPYRNEMATPPLAGALEAQVILASNTGFSRDSVVNTFHFDRVGTAPLGTVLPLVRDALVGFYNAGPIPTGGGSANPIANWISSTISRVSNASTIKIYDLSLAAPRVPTVYQFTLGAYATGETGVPLEVAMCLSMKTNLPTRRGRGRIYIGPLVSGAINLDPPNIHPNGGMLNSLRWSGANLRDSFSAEAGMPRWSVYSRMGNLMHAVTEVWVDNEFDTQRRRGHRATTRVTA